MNTPKCRVLLVDDHKPTRDAVRSLLMPHNDIEIVAEAGDGEEAIELASSCQPDVILMDINMPKMNGIEAAAVIKKSWKNTAIIGLSGMHDAYTMEAFLKAGALAVLTKDRPDDLYPTIQRTCMGRTPRTEL